MKLLTETIKNKAFEQYKLGADMEQMVVAKFFSPVGAWTWYLMNIDPTDCDYCWGVVKGNEVETGSFSLSELQNLKLPLNLGIERDLSFKPMKAIDVFNKLKNGEHV